MQTELTGFALHLEKCKVVNTKVIDVVVSDSWIRINTTTPFINMKEIDGEYIETKDNFVLVPKSAFLHTIGLIPDYADLVKLMRMVPETIPHLMLNADIDISIYKRLANAEYIDYQGHKRMNTNDYNSLLYNVADIYFESTSELFTTAIKLGSAVIALDEELAKKYRNEIADIKARSVLSTVRRRQRNTVGSATDTAATNAADSATNATTTAKDTDSK